MDNNPFNFGMKTKKANFCIQKLCKKTTDKFKVYDLIIKSGLDQIYPEVLEDFVFFNIERYFKQKKKYN